MNKFELLTEVSTKAEVSKTNTEKVLEAFYETVMTNVTSGEDVKILGFGNFQRKNRAARKSRNPKTGESVQVPPTRTVKFKAGRHFKDAVSGKNK